MLSLAVHLAGALLSPPRCIACDEPVRFRTVFCPSCASTLVRSHRADAAFEYGGAMAKAIGRFKYEDRPDLGEPLGAALARMASRIAPIDGIVPVPLHPKRLAERGYNQAALLARPLARVLGAPIFTGVVLRERDTARQAELDRSARMKNVERAFRCCDQEGARMRRWLLVDDVRTTGATLRACAQALEEAGAARVFPLALAVAL